MRLWIIRHGKAEQDSPTGRDEHRLLRDRGRRQAQWLGETLRDSDTPPTLILSSGLLRAIETARIIQGSLGCSLLVEPALETGHDADEALELIESHPDARSLAIVGHNPQLDSLIAVLAGTGVQAVHLRTGEAVALEVPGRPAVERGGATVAAAIRLEEPAEPVA
ncbi:MAG TPA: histidine phosphatase family protein [Phycisphaerales bacterium]|nr:histidine phosphatase family protein [Phycisphaerales bacterium]